MTDISNIRILCEKFLLFLASTSEMMQKVAMLLAVFEDQEGRLNEITNAETNVKCN